jgi:hypothetical protein
LSNIANISTQECLSEKQLLQYCNKQLHGSALRNVEMHISTCDMCADAVEGFALMATSDRQAAHYLKNPFETAKPAKPFLGFLTNKIWLMASSLLLLFGISYAIYNNNKQETVAANIDKKDNNTEFVKQNSNNEIPKDNAATESKEINTDAAVSGVKKDITPIEGTNAIATNSSENTKTENNTAQNRVENTEPNKIKKALETATPKLEADYESNKYVAQKEKSNLEIAASPAAAAPAPVYNYTETKDGIATNAEQMAATKTLADNNNANYRTNESVTNLRKPKQSKSLPSNVQNNYVGNANNDNSNALQQEMNSAYKTKQKASARPSNTNAENKLKDANTYLDNKNYTSALLVYNALPLEYKNANPNIYLNIAKCYYATAQNDVAEKVIETYASLTNMNAKKLSKVKAAMKKDFAVSK